LLVVGTSNNDIRIHGPAEAGGYGFNANNPNAGEFANCPNLYFQAICEYAEIASWTSALQAADYSALLAGAPPETVSPGTLYDVWDLKPGGAAGSAAPSTYTGLVNARTLTASGTVTVSSYAHPVTRTPTPTLTGSVTMDNMAPTGSMFTQPLSSMNGSVTLDEMLASGTLGLQPGMIASEPFKNWSGTVQAGVTVPKVTVLRISDMSTVLNLTNQVTSGAGVLTITSSAMTPGVRYLLVCCDATGTAFGAEPYTAT
jgi:hypothetical protein